ncbi:hypothetical protein JCM10908_002505 [Rhodotorula pacifica]|uniref:uncharacterized protein n=1 Tax=Rhodotorula pacifica TaxID=1495444 RepID=UPI00316E1D47
MPPQTRQLAHGLGLHSFESKALLSRRRTAPMMSDSIPVRRGSASSPLPPSSHHHRQPFSASAFDDFMGLPTSNSHERVAPIPARPATTATTSSATSTFGRKLRAFPWSRSSVSATTAADKKQQKQASVSARERIISSAGPEAPKPGPSILKNASPNTTSSPSLPMGFPAPPPSTSSSVSSVVTASSQRAQSAAQHQQHQQQHQTSSNASLSTVTSFASTSMFASTSASDDSGWHSEATSVSLTSSPEIGHGSSKAATFPSMQTQGIDNSSTRMRNFRRAVKDSASSGSGTGAGVRPFSVLSDIVERDNEDGAGARASMYDVLSLYSVPPPPAPGADIPVRRVSTPIPPAVALMLAAEPPATPPRQKRWSTSSIDDSPTSLRRTAPKGGGGGDEADDEVSPPRGVLRRRNSLDSPGSASGTRRGGHHRRISSSSVRIPSMRFDGISMEAMFAEVEARVNRQLAAKQLGAGETAAVTITAVRCEENATAAAVAAVKKQARRKSRVMSLQEPLSFEISTPVFGSTSVPGPPAAMRKPKPATPRREATLAEEEEEEEESPVARSPVPRRTSSRPEPLDLGAAKSVSSARWGPRSAPLRPAAPFFGTSSASELSAVTPTSPVCDSPTSPTPANGTFSVLEPATAKAAAQASPRLQGSIPELLVCPPSPPERPKRRAPPPPLQLAPAPKPAAQQPFPTMARQQQPPSPAPSQASSISAARPLTMVNGETKVTLVQTEKKYVRLSTRAQTTRRTGRPRTFSVPVQPTPPPQVMMYSPQTPSTPTFEITPPPPDSPVESPIAQPASPLAAAMVALPFSEPSTPVRQFMVEGSASRSGSPVSISPTPSSTATVTAAPYHPPSVLRTDYHPALSNLMVAYPNSDESSSECEESFQDMLIRLNRPHTPPRKVNKPAASEESSKASSLTKSAMELHNTSHSRLSMLARELGEAMLSGSSDDSEDKENHPVLTRRDKSLVPSTDTRRYSKLFAAGEVDLSQFDGGSAVLVSSQAEPQSPTVMHHLRPIDSEHGHAGEEEEETWHSLGSHDGLCIDISSPANGDMGEEADIDVESELDRTIASLMSDESAASVTSGSGAGASTMSRSGSELSTRSDSDSSLASLDVAAGAVIVEAKKLVQVAPPRSPVTTMSGHRSQLSDSSIGSTSTSTSTETDEGEEGVVCLGERISCSYNRGVIGVAM